MSAVIHSVCAIVIVALYFKIVAHKQKLDPSLTSNIHKVMFLSNIDMHTFGDVTVAMFALLLLILNVYIVASFNNILPDEVNLYPNYLVILFIPILLQNSIDKLSF